jgi:hypothetical protein
LKAVILSGAKNPDAAHATHTARTFLSIRNKRMAYGVSSQSELLAARIATPDNKRMGGIGRSRIKLLSIGIPATVLAAILAYWEFSETASIDACQDQGGKYDYASKSCIGSRYQK